MSSQFSLSLSEKTVQSLIKVSESEDRSEEKGKMNPVFCYLCDDVFEDEDSLRIHVENCGKTFYCAKCNDNFKSKQNLQEHIASVHDGSITVYGNKTQFYCGICQLTFSSKQTYFTHISYVHVAVNDVKEPIFGKKDNVHVRKNNLERASSDGIKKNYFQCEIGGGVPLPFMFNIL